MGILSFFKRTPRLNHEFDDKDRALAIERKRINSELETMKKRHAMAEENQRHELEMMRIQAEIEDLQEELGYDDEPESSGSVEDKLAMMLVDKVLSKSNVGDHPVAQATTPPPSIDGGVSIPDEQLKTMWASVPQHIKNLAPQCSDEQVREFIKSQLPSANAETVERAVQIVRA